MNDFPVKVAPVGLHNVIEKDVHVKNLYVQNGQVPECGSIFNVTVTKHSSAQNGNITECTGTKCLSYKTFTITNKTFIFTKRP
jgi:hypothetical protein